MYIWWWKPRRERKRLAEFQATRKGDSAFDSKPVISVPPPIYKDPKRATRGLMMAPVPPQVKALAAAAYLAQVGHEKYKQRKAASAEY